MADLGKMSKKQLESYARKELGVELDRRHSKKQLLAKVQGLLEDQEEVEVLTPPVTPKAAASSIDVRKHIEGIATSRRDAAIIHEIIKSDAPGVGTDDEIRKLVKSKNFDTLLGEIS